MHSKSNILKFEKKNGKSFTHQKDSSYYLNIINEYLEFIEKQCFKAVIKRLKGHSRSKSINVENEAIELSNRVLDRLRNDDCGVLRQFKGNSRLSTYITAIIANHAVDMIRRKRGRSREKERAKEFGKLGFDVYSMVIVEGLSISETYNNLKSQSSITVSMEDLEEIVDKIRGKGNPERLAPENNRIVKNGTFVEENGEFVIPDVEKNPEEVLLGRDLEEKRSKVLNGIISRLSGEEKLILRMRFDADQGMMSERIQRISEVMGISKKAVYNRVSRILKKCRDISNLMGVKVDDLL